MWASSAGSSSACSPAPSRGRSRRAGGIGCFGTLAVGVVGALLGGFLGEAILDEDIDVGWDLKPFLLAVAGAVVLLLLLNAVRRR